jgi:hypothetical protein
MDQNHKKGHMDRTMFCCQHLYFLQKFTSHVDALAILHGNGHYHNGLQQCQQKLHDLLSASSNFKHNACQTNFLAIQKIFINLPYGHFHFLVWQVLWYDAFAFKEIACTDYSTGNITRTYNEPCRLLNKVSVCKTDFLFNVEKLQ